MTMGWKRPIMRKVARPIINPEKFIYVILREVRLEGSGDFTIYAGTDLI